jgi:hypothetical protein
LCHVVHCASERVLKMSQLVAREVAALHGSVRSISCPRLHERKMGRVTTALHCTLSSRTDDTPQ